MSDPQAFTLTYVEGSTDPEQQLDLYLPSPSTAASPLVVFIHGGAWRSGSRSAHSDLAKYLSQKGTAVAIIDYRLSTKDEKTGETKVVHPAHAQDVNAALSFLTRRNDVPQQDWVVVGHSIGAWLALAAVINGAPPSGSSKYPASMPVPDAGVGKAIKTLVLVDGLLSVTQLLKEYPDYESFVAQAFLPQPGPSNYDIVSTETWPLGLQDKTLHVWHSRDDELLSFKQSIDILLHLDEQLGASQSSKAVTVKIPEDGMASETNVGGQKKSIKDVYGEVQVQNSDRLHADFTTLKGAHDDLLHTEIFFNLVFELC